MSDVVQFPGTTPAPEVPTDLDPNEVHAQAFRDTLMAFAIAGLFAEGETVIENVDCVATSYPDFYKTLEQILVEGLFHADPHPGNVFLTDDHRVALIDLGMVARQTASPMKLASGPSPNASFRTVE